MGKTSRKCKPTVSRFKIPPQLPWKQGLFSKPWKKNRWPLPQTINLYLLPDYALKSTYRCLIQEGFCALEQVPKHIPLTRYLNTENSVSYFSAFYCLFASSCNFLCTGSPWCLHLDFLFHSGEQTHKYARLSSNLTLRHQTSFHLCIILFPERIQLY